MNYSVMVVCPAPSTLEAGQISLRFDVENCLKPTAKG
jgi:hypothetical protein